MSEYPNRPNYARAFIRQEIKASNSERREITHLITTPAVDRMGDIVESKGAELSYFVDNPVVLADHNYSVESVIGKATDIRVTRDGISATTKFRETTLAEAAYRLALEGLGGWSIGFRPLESHSIREGRKAGCKRCEKHFDEVSAGKDPDEVYIRGFHFGRWEMLEYSSVAIPANQEIVNQAVSRGLIPAPLVCRFFAIEAQEAQPGHAPADQGPTARAEHPQNHPALLSLSKRLAREAGLLHAADRMDDIVRRLRETEE